MSFHLEFIFWNQFEIIKHITLCLCNIAWFWIIEGMIDDFRTLVLVDNEVFTCLSHLDKFVYYLQYLLHVKWLQTTEVAFNSFSLDSIISLRSVVIILPINTLNSVNKFDIFFVFNGHCHSLPNRVYNNYYFWENNTVIPH
jgi:hypothetical protein